MSDYSSFAGVRVTAMSLWWPLLGLWTADVSMAVGDTLPTSGTLQHGNLSLQGAVYRQGSLGGVTRARLVGGAGGWGTVVQARGYQAAFGVLLSQVLNDVAIECGERIAVQSDRVIGTAWSRPQGPGGNVLRAAAGPLWWVDASGVVQVGPRTSAPIQTPFDALDWDGGAGIVTVSSDDVASWVPGNTFSSALMQPMQTIAAVRHVVDNEGVARMRILVQ